MKVVYVVSYMPSFEGASMAGFDWYLTENEARDELIRHVSAERAENIGWSHDYTMRSMLVPRHYSNDQVTEYLDTEMIEFRELPLPPEWEAIRDLGGAIDLTDKDDDSAQD
jgi:hypothetical protein